MTTWRRSFLPGRSFASPADFNTQLQDWLARANTRHRRALGCAPDRPDRRRPGGDAGAAAGAAGDRVAVRDRGCRGTTTSGWTPTTTRCTRR